MWGASSPTLTITHLLDLKLMWTCTKAAALSSIQTGLSLGYDLFNKMEDVLPATEHLGHRQLNGNLTLDKLKSNWKERRGSGGTVNTSDGCWRHSGKSFSSLCAGWWSNACGAEGGLSRALVEKEEVVLMCCEHVDGNVTYSREI